MNSRNINSPQSSRTFESPKIEVRRETQPAIIAGIPAHNEALYIDDVVRRARKYVDQVIVVNDGSTDDTARVAEAAGALVVSHQSNGGAGAATETLFTMAKRKNAGSLITLDGDGQHNPDEIPLILAPILNGEADIVIGSRFVSSHEAMPIYREFGIRLINFFFNLGSKVKITDTQCCYRAYGERAIQNLDISERGFAFSLEILLQAVQKGLTIREVPTSCIYHAGAHNINPIIHGSGIIFRLMRLRLARIWHNPTYNSKDKRIEVTETD